MSTFGNITRQLDTAWQLSELIGLKVSPAKVQLAMTHKFSCQHCALEFNVSDKLFDERIAGKRVSLRCKRCYSTVTTVEDGQSAEMPGAGDSHPLPPASQTMLVKPNRDADKLREAATLQRPPAPRRLKTPPIQRIPRNPVPRQGEPVALHGSGVSKAAKAAELTASTDDPMPIISLGSESKVTEGATEQSTPSTTVAMSQTENNAPELSSCTEARRAEHLEDAEAELTPPATTMELEELPPLDWPAPDVADPMLDIANPPIPRESAERTRMARQGVAAVMFAALSVLGIAAIVSLLNTHRSQRSASAVAAPAPTRATAEVAAVTPTGSVSPSEKTLPNESAPARSEAQPSSTGSPSDNALPDYVFKPAVAFLTGRAVHRAERCDPKGHPVGTARVFFTFSPNGRVTEANIEGEPIASAPVARCILRHALAIRMKGFDGPAFTVSLPITLR